MLGRSYDDQVCSVARALEIVGERWTLLIVRDALLGTTRFEEFLGGLGIARNVLADRLQALVCAGILDRTPYRYRPLRHEYQLTTKGRDLGVVVISLMEWGDRYLAGGGGPPRLAEHLGCGGHVTAELMCHSCGRALPAVEVATRPGPGRAARAATDVVTAPGGSRSADALGHRG